jgi:hypothetical protein
VCAQAIGRDHVETGSGQNHEPTPARFGVIPSKNLDRVHFARNIEVMRSNLEACAQHRLDGADERSRGVENDARTLERFCEPSRVLGIRFSSFETETSCRVAQPRPISGHENRLESQSECALYDESGGVTGRTEDE